MFERTDSNSSFFQRLLFLLKKRRVLSFFFILSSVTVASLLVISLFNILQGRATGVPQNEDVVEILPQMIRTENEGYSGMRIRDPFYGSGILGGVITNNSGNSISIIETAKASYIASVGDTIDDYWTLQEIFADQVLLEGRGEYLRLYLNEERTPGIMETRTSGIDTNEERNTTNHGDNILFNNISRSVSPAANSSVPAFRLSGSNIITDFRGVDIRDALSAFAVGMGVNILYIEDAMDVTFQVKNVSTRKAFELFLQQLSMTYLEDNNVLIVGREGRISEDFFNRMVLTRIDLKYISAPNLENALSVLDIPIIIIALDNNQASIWVQGAPFALMKVREVVDKLDIPDNADVDIHSLFSKYRLQHVNADIIISIASEVGLEIKGVALDNNPKVLLVYGDAEEKRKLQSLISEIDVAENRESIQNLTGYNLIYITAETLRGMVADLDISLYMSVLEANPQTLWVYGDSREKEKLNYIVKVLDTPQNAKKAQPLVRFDLYYLTVNHFSSMINNLDIPVNIVDVEENNPKVFWVQGDPSEIEKVRELVNAVDRFENEDENYRVFVYQLENTVAKEIEDRLGFFGFEGVELITFSFSEFGQDILVISPPHLEDYVYKAISSLDAKRQFVKVPVASAAGENASNKLLSQREVLSELTGVPVANMVISINLSGDSVEPHYILWVEDTPDNLQKIVAMVEMIGIISGP